MFTPEYKSRGIETASILLSSAPSSREFLNTLKSFVNVGIFIQQTVKHEAIESRLQKHDYGSPVGEAKDDQQ